LKAGYVSFSAPEKADDAEMTAARHLVACSVLRVTQFLAVIFSTHCRSNTRNITIVLSGCPPASDNLKEATQRR